MDSVCIAFLCKYTTLYVIILDVYYIGNSSGPLPIELIEFRAEKFNLNNVHVIWTTASEVNNNYFTVERFTEGNEWKEVARVKGADNSSEIINYEVFDKNPPCGLFYYRLKQTDFDGNFRYSDVEAVKFVCDRNLITYPNPSTGIVTIEFTSELNEIIYVEAISVTGGILTVEPKSSGRNKFAIDLSSLPAGIYFLKIETSVQTYFEKINILK